LDELSGILDCFTVSDLHAKKQPASAKPCDDA